MWGLVGVFSRDPVAISSSAVMDNGGISGAVKKVVIEQLDIFLPIFE